VEISSCKNVYREVQSQANKPSRISGCLRDIVWKNKYPGQNIKNKESAKKSQYGKNSRFRTSFGLYDQDVDIGGTQWTTTDSNLRHPPGRPPKRWQEPASQEAG